MENNQEERISSNFDLNGLSSCLYSVGIQSFMVMFVMRTATVNKVVSMLAVLKSLWSVSERFRVNDACKTNLGLWHFYQLLWLAEVCKNVHFFRWWWGGKQSGQGIVGSNTPWHFTHTSYPSRQLYQYAGWTVVDTAHWQVWGTFWYSSASIDCGCSSL